MNPKHEERKSGKEKRHRTLPPIKKNYGTRNKEYDAFISYHDDSFKTIQPQKNIVYKTMLPFLESQCDPAFKIVTHPRNFIAGNAIKDSILKAIWNSNAVIILMSKEYASSMWCKYEFEASGFENMKDPAFRMIVILYESLQNLGELTPEMSAFLENRTYLDINDSELLEKVADILRSIRPSEE